MKQGKDVTDISIYHPKSMALTMEDYFGISIIMEKYFFECHYLNVVSTDIRCYVVDLETSLNRKQRFCE